MIILDLARVSSESHLLQFTSLNCQTLQLLIVCSKVCSKKAKTLLYTLKEHQSFLSKTTVSKVSDSVSQFISMKENIFKLCAKIWEMCDKNNIGLIYFRLGRSELCWLFSIFTKDDFFQFSPRMTVIFTDLSGKLVTEVISCG